MDYRKAEPTAWSRRPNFVPRQMLTAEQLNAGLADELNRQRLINRAVHGYGVVEGFGLEVAADGALDLDRGCCKLTGGLALDRHGRMLYWPGGRLGIADLAGPPPDHEGLYTLRVHYAGRAPRADDCGPDFRWRADGVVFTLRPGCEDADRRCPEHPGGSCVGHDEYLCRRTGGRPGADPGSVPESPDVEWLVRPPGPLRPIDCEDWAYDPEPAVAVPIACLRICDVANRAAGEHEHGDDRPPAARDCDPRFGFCPSRPASCRVRPLVYRNPLLYELTNGCDVELSRVHRISWQRWIDPGWREEVPWTAFRDRLNSREHGFEVWFSRPIEAATLHSASVFMTVQMQDNSDYWTTRQVPLRLIPLGESGPVARGVRLAPADDWLRSQVNDSRSSLFSGVRVAVTVRGQLLRDDCGHLLDARPIGVSGRARQSRPGGDFVSTFRVGRNPDRDRREHHHDDELSDR